MSADGEGNADNAGEGAGGNIPRCPICGKPRDPNYRPFCSKRCADVDLGRWLKGSYAIPSTERRTKTAIPRLSRKASQERRGSDD